MAEFIEKAAILSKCEEMWNNADETTQTGVDTINAIDRITDFIEAMPAADVQLVKRGRWIGINEYCKKNGYIPSGMGIYYWCSECGKEEPKISDYCPNCGARMDGDKANNVRNLTDEETEIYESWIDHEAKDTGVNIMDGDT